MSDPIIWPSAALPGPSNAFAIDMEEASLRTKMDSGLVRQRRRFTTEKAQFSVTWEMSDEEFQIFRAWHAEKLNMGNGWFQVDLPVGGGTTTQTVRFVEGKFKSDYVPVSNWNISAILECLAPSRLPTGMVDLILDPEFVEELPLLELSIEEYYLLTHTTFPTEFP